MAHDVFISYAEEDRQVADAACRALEDAGVRCWYAPRDVPYAIDYEDAIVDAIAGSKLLVLILSAHSNNSTHVKREMQNACREEPQIPVLPFQIGNISLNKALRYYIGSVQWLSAITPPLGTHLEKLVAYVQSCLPQREEEKDPTKQTEQPTEPEVRAGAEEAERGRAKESSPTPEPADAGERNFAESPFEQVMYWLIEKPTRMLVFGLALGAFISIWLFYESRQQPTNQNTTPTSTQKPDARTSAHLSAAEQAAYGDDLFFQEKYAEAELYYRRAVYLEPDNDSYQNKLGDALARQEKYAEAEPSYREAARLNPNEERHKFSLGRALIKQKKYEQAEQAYGEAMRRNPADGTIRDYLGDVLYLQSKYAEAETRYREALHISPNNAAFHYSLGNALFAQRKNNEARLEYQKAVQLDSGNGSYREALRRMSK